MPSAWLTVAIVAMTFVGIALGRFPWLKCNRATIALVGVGGLLVARQVRFEDLGALVDVDTIVLLFSMMVINANLRIAGFFGWVGQTLLRNMRSPRSLLAAEILAAGVLSALFLNDTICLMFTPLVVQVARSARRQPVPYLIALATAANIGSAATITGNPQNMIIGVASGLSYQRFAAALTPVAMLGLGVVWLVLVLVYRQEFSREALDVAPAEPIVLIRPLLAKSLAVAAGLLIAFLAGAPVALAAFVAACVLLVTRRVHPHQVFAEIDWSLLVFFCGLFVLTGALDRNGVTRDLLLSLRSDGSQTGVWGLTAVSTALSNLVSNVPAVLLLKPLVAALPTPEAGWITLAASSTLAGNLTLLGSVANLIVAESASRQGVNLSFWVYTRAGLVITIVSLLLGGFWLQLFVWP